MEALYSDKPALYGLDIDSVIFDEKRIDTMPPDRAQRIRSLRFLDDRKRSFAAGLLLEAALGREALFRIRRYDNGKPYIDGGPCFSISHSGNWAVLAVCRENTGFDIEFAGAGRDTALIARHAFQPEEIEAAGCDAGMFYRIWTAKESYLKMLGCYPLSISGFCVQLEGEAGRVKGSAGTEIRFFEQFDGYAAAVSAPAGTEWPRELTVLSGI
ncbi:MAG: 4'-phosphopantetheinyl transferase superfamily protein [Spirochaetaceae bacterium]|jgi:4'-phosphopantetheinyl transferase|nr:4'-phosphopantetheinyl transferase superfamily protein [Spirochaetaceae bacterium]